MAKVYGYVRVSKADQNEARLILALPLYPHFLIRILSLTLHSSNSVGIVLGGFRASPASVL